MPADGCRMHFVPRGRGVHPDVPRAGDWELHSHCTTWESGDADGKQADEALPSPGHKTWLHGKCKQGFVFIPSPSGAFQEGKKALFWELHHTSCHSDQAMTRGRDGLGVTVWATEGGQQQESCGCCSPALPVNKLTQNAGIR